MMARPPDAGLSGARRALRAVDAVSTGMALAGGILFMLTALYITLDVLGRNFAGVSSAVTDEMGGYALAFGGMWAVAYTLRTNGHVRIDVLLPHLPRRARALLTYAAMSVMMSFAALVALYTWTLAIDSYQIDARAVSFLRTPLYVPQALMAIGLSALALEAFVILAVGLVESIRSRRLVDLAGSEESGAAEAVPTL
jgi:TRAP-type mannitol/chloroaromatic compound transport system permease small subunit